MAESTIRDRLIGGWRLMGYVVTADGKTDHPLGEHPHGAILYTPDGYMSALTGRPSSTARTSSPSRCRNEVPTA
jgi:hypothetical protein